MSDINREKMSALSSVIANAIEAGIAEGLSGLDIAAALAANVAAVRKAYGIGDNFNEAFLTVVDAFYEEI